MLATIIISIVLAVIVALIIGNMYKKKKNGKSFCGCSGSACSGCSGACRSKK